MSSVGYAMLGVAVGMLVFSCEMMNCASGDDHAIGGSEIRPTKLWSFLDDNDEMVLQRFEGHIEEYNVGSIRCSRYCIEMKELMEKMPSVLDMVWNFEGKSEMVLPSTFDEDHKSEIFRKQSKRYKDSDNTQSRCAFSIVMECGFSNSGGNSLGEIELKFLKSLQSNLQTDEDFRDKYPLVINFLSERIVDNVAMINEKEVSFQVKPNQVEMSVIITGNVSRIELKMPIGLASLEDNSATTTKEKVAAPQLILATTRMPDGVSLGVRLNVINPPPGGWRLQTNGMDNQSYRLVVAAQAAVPDISNTMTILDMGGRAFSLENVNAQGISSRQVKFLDDFEDEDEVRMSNHPESEDALMPRILSKPDFFNQQERQRPFGFPIDESKDTVSFNPGDNITTSRMDVVDLGIESRVIDREFLDLADSSNPLNEELPLRKYLTVELSPRSELIANPGSYHRLTFEITNNHVLRIRHYLFPSSSPFQIYGLPRYVDIAPGQTANVPIDVIVPSNVADTVNKVTLRVEGIEIVEKSANFYVRSSTNGRVYDDKRPEIHYYFNNNCNGRTSGEKCLKSFWSVDIVVQDVDSGLKSVTSVPKGIYARTPYVSGTSSPVKFFYAHNCCNRVIEVTATDSSGNVYSRRIDVDEWTNLTTGEILAVIFITLFIILLIILIAISIVYCIKRRQSHELPYSQRYGSRSSPQ